MALPKRIKVGGSYYQGYSLNVASTPGDYTLLITQTSGMAVNSLSITPDAYGSGDIWSLTHYKDAVGTGQVLSILATNMNNMGKNATIMLDFPAAELMQANESLKFVYTNSSTTALNVYLIAEAIGIKKVV